MLNRMHGRVAGTALVLLSALAWSLNGLYSRFLTVDVWTTLVGRAIATAATLLLALLLIHGRGTGQVLRHNARIAIWVILAGAFTMITFVASLFTTSVANVTVIYSMSPLLAALLARVLIGDLLVARTMVAFAVAMVGVVIMVGGSFGTERLVGDLLALAMSASFAVVIVEMRRKPQIDNVASSFMSSVLLAVVLAPLATLGGIGLSDAVVLFLFGFTSNVLGFFAFVAGVRRIPPAEAGLIATVEIVLAPLWVWLLFAEDPGEAALIGGAIVVAAILFHLSGEIFRRNPVTASTAGHRRIRS
jgi:drug/metabolite transporter (DMT)-like permease